jgi:signal peptidase
MKDLDRIVTWLRRLVDVALVALVAAVLATVAVAKLPELAGGRTFVVAGGSMEPAIGKGSALAVMPVAPDAIEVGNVVSMRVPPRDTLFTHRVTRVVQRDGQPLFETGGDANAAPDPSLVPPGWIVGRVETVFPMIGYLVALLSIPSGLVFVLGVGAMLLVTGWLLEDLTRRTHAAGHVPADRSALSPSQMPASELLRRLIGADVAGVHRMVPDGKRHRPGWTSAAQGRPTEAG